MTSKLATIVALDVCGYSARAQADEAEAVASVARLQKRAVDVAAAHGGRVFSTAGDAALMEFSSVSNGLEAAETLASDPDPPVRVGVHLGEVSEMPSGDLLGHGVNVAARLQAHAREGHVLVSEDARRALRGPLAARLVAKGVIKLDKIDESIAVFELAPEAAATMAPPDAAHRDARRMRLVAFGAVGLVVAALAALGAWQFLRPDPPVRVAAFSLSAPDGDADLQRVARGVSDDVSLSLSAIGVQTLARADTASEGREQRLDRARDLNAALVLDGAVERTGADVRINVAVLRSSDRTTLWSSAYSMPASQAAGLQLRAAQNSADIMSCGAKAMRRGGANLDSEMLALFLRACESTRDSPLQMHDALVQVVAREPRFTLARARLALSGVMASFDAPDPMHTSLRESARADAERALREDGRIGESYIALSLIEPLRHYADRENLLRQALARDELNGTVNNFYADLLGEMGRLAEALPYARHGLALDPLSPSKRRGLAYLLLMTGDGEAARDIVEAMAPAWPEHPRLWRARMHIALWSGRFEDALALLDAPGSTARSHAAKACWREAVQALRAASAQRARRILECHRSGTLPSNEVVMLLAVLGDLDNAFALIRNDPAPDVFAPQSAPLRRDRRFMPLMRDIGLLRYWSLSGHWPDFCREPGLPYNCEIEARRLL